MQVVGVGSAQTASVPTYLGVFSDDLSGTCMMVD